MRASRRYELNLGQNHVTVLPHSRWRPLFNSMFSIKLTWLSGCAGGNGVYSLFTVFFFGSRRLARFLWRNLGRKRSQLCIRSSGSLDSSRLIISVWWFQQSEYGMGGGWSGINKIVTLWCHAIWAACANLDFYYHQLSILNHTDVLLLLAVTF